MVLLQKGCGCFCSEVGKTCQEFSDMVGFSLIFDGKIRKNSLFLLRHSWFASSYQIVRQSTAP